MIVNNKIITNVEYWRKGYLINLKDDFRRIGGKNKKFRHQLPSFFNFTLNLFLHNLGQHLKIVFSLVLHICLYLLLASSILFSH